MKACLDDIFLAQLFNAFVSVLGYCESMYKGYIWNFVLGKNIGVIELCAKINAWTTTTTKAATTQKN